MVGEESLTVVGAAPGLEVAWHPGPGKGGWSTQKDLASPWTLWKQTDQIQ